MDLYVEQSGEAGVGVIARTSTVEVIFSAYRVLWRCASADEAETWACAEGVRLASK